MNFIVLFCDHCLYCGPLAAEVLTILERLPSGAMRRHVSAIGGGVVPDSFCPPFDDLFWLCVRWSARCSRASMVDRVRHVSSVVSFVDFLSAVDGFRLCNPNPSETSQKSRELQGTKRKEALRVT